MKSTTNNGSRLYGTRFSMVPEWVLYGGVSDRALRVYAVLGRHADSHSGVAFPRRRRLADLCSCSVKSIDRAVAELVEIGAVIVQHRQSENGEYASNLYILVFDDPRARVSESGDRAGGDLATQLSLPQDPAGDLTRTTEREPLNDTLAAAPRKRKPDLLWEVFDEELGEVSNTGERGKRNRALKLIRESMNGLDDEVEQAVALRTHIERYREHWPDMPATEMAIANNWTVTMRAPKRKRGLTSEEIRALGRGA
jgi:Helix-turn-helix domain